ncbi:MAG: hypothetical protein ABEJ93_00375 [Candidatus Nanohalobium sp.]
MNKKILLVGWGFPPKIDGGLDIHVKHLFEELREKDVEVELALPEDRAPDREGIVPVETGDRDMVQRSRKQKSLRSRRYSLPTNQPHSSTQRPPQK